MRTKFRVLIVLLFAVIFVGCSVGQISSSAGTDTDSNGTETYADLSGYYLVEEDSHLIQISIDDLIRKFEQGETFTVFIGYKDCYWCNRAIPVYNEIANEKPEYKLYYLDIRGEDITADKYDNLLQCCSDILIEGGDGEKSLYVPNCIGVRNGKITKNKLSLTDDYNYADQDVMTDEQKAELKQLYLDIIDSAK